MFTGLVQAVGTVRSAQKRGRALRLAIDTGRWPYGSRARIGDSVSVSGVCLTVVKPTGRTSKRVLEFDLVPETLDKTRLGKLQPGDEVNLEHAATADTLFGGHVVQGHIDGRGNVSRIDRGDDWRVWIDLPANLRPLMASKGSVTVEGVSLTIAGLTRKGISVALIPETLEKTTLIDLTEGDAVNIEADILAKMVARAKELRPRRKAQIANRKSPKTRKRP